MNKILIDLERLRYPNSGIANVFKNLANGLENKNIPFEVSYFGPKEELRKNIQYKKIIAYQKWHKFFETFSKSFDIVHISHQGTPYFRKEYKNSIKILTLHDLNYLHENLSKFKKQRIYRRINKSFENVDYLVCISEFVKQDLLKNKHLFNFKKLKDIFVIHNGIELPQERIYSLGRFEYLTGKKYILNIGVLVDKKNQKSLIEMLSYLEEDLVLVASDKKEPYMTIIKQRIIELNLQDRVHFLNCISEEEKFALIQNCQAMCHPSIAEGFGIPPIEAMAFGKPVFLSKYTSLPEIGGEFAFYFDDFNAQGMANYYQSKMKYFQENQLRLEKEIKKWASIFDYRIMAENYLKVYKKILSLK